MKTTLLMLSCNRIESAKFIHVTLSLAKLVYYNMNQPWFSLLYSFDKIGDYFQILL